MNTANIQTTLKKGDKVAYYIARRVSYGNGIERRTGIVQGWRDGKVVVLHKAGYTEDLNAAALYIIE